MQSCLASSSQYQLLTSSNGEVLSTSAYLMSAVTEWKAKGKYTPSETEIKRSSVKVEEENGEVIWSAEENNRQNDFVSVGHGKCAAAEKVPLVFV